jgi:hypothetical protein
MPAVTLASLETAKIASNADIVAIFANETDDGGCALPAQHIIEFTRTYDAGETLAHELGHALFGLADEYGGGGSSCNVAASNGINVGNELTSLPWKSMLTTTTLPTPEGTKPDVVGGFEGANYCDEGVYRPADTCLMRNQFKGLCPVCTCQFERTLIARQTERKCASPATLNPKCNGTTKDSCADKADGNYCSEIDSSASYACKDKAHVPGQSCQTNKKCTGFDGKGVIQCQ